MSTIKPKQTDSAAAAAAGHFNRTARTPRPSYYFSARGDGRQGGTTREHQRLHESESRIADWKCLGPYVSDRGWGTVREDYSANGDAWSFFPHEHARSRAYRWSEDGIAGVCNRFQNVILSLAFWNSKDAILKERLFGLGGMDATPHGEDVKELYFYVDNTPTHSFFSMRYIYPFEYPYAALVAENARRSRKDPEAELWEVYGADRMERGEFWDVNIEYGKASPDEILCRIRATNASSTPQELSIIPQLFFRNTWSWGYDPDKPQIFDAGSESPRVVNVAAEERHLGAMRWSVCVPQCTQGYVVQPLELLLTDNETNFKRCYGDVENIPPGSTCKKDAFNTYITGDNAFGSPGSVSTLLPPRSSGTKAAVWTVQEVPPLGVAEVWIRFCIDGHDGEGEEDAHDGAAARDAQSRSSSSSTDDGVGVGGGAVPTRSAGTTPHAAVSATPAPQSTFHIGSEDRRSLSSHSLGLPLFEDPREDLDDEFDDSDVERDDTAGHGMSADAGAPENKGATAAGAPDVFSRLLPRALHLGAAGNFSSVSSSSASAEQATTPLIAPSFGSITARERVPPSRQRSFRTQQQPQQRGLGSIPLSFRASYDDDIGSIFNAPMDSSSASSGFMRRPQLQQQKDSGSTAGGQEHRGHSLADPLHRTSLQQVTSTSVYASPPRECGSAGRAVSTSADRRLQLPVSTAAESTASAFDHHAHAVSSSSEYESSAGESNFDQLPRVMTYTSDGHHGDFHGAMSHSSLLGPDAASLFASTQTPAKAWRRTAAGAGAGSASLLQQRHGHGGKPPLEHLSFVDFLAVMATRSDEADDFYHAIAPPGLPDDERRIQRQAYAGLLWSKQYYHFGVDMWLLGDPAFPPPPAQRLNGRNTRWRNFYANDVLSMPDKWEYNWFAAWDLNFQMIPTAILDPEWAKRQLILLTREWYMHPSGALPAYEWNFDDANPPLHAWACWRVYQITGKVTGQRDLVFLERCFHKLLLNFSFWANKIDKSGHNLFEGGFLGLDNISLFDRSTLEGLPPGTRLEQADSTAWMAMFSADMLTISLELAQYNPAYEDIATKFLEHFVSIAHSINGGEGSGTTGLYDTEDEFFYDYVHEANGTRRPLKVKSYIGLIPLFAVTTISEEVLRKLPSFTARLNWFCKHRRHMIERHHHAPLSAAAAAAAASESRASTSSSTGGDPSGSRGGSSRDDGQGGHGSAAAHDGGASLGSAACTPAPPVAGDAAGGRRGRHPPPTTGGAAAPSPSSSSHGGGGCRLLSLVTMDQLPKILKRMLNEAEFLAPGGLRSLSKEHEAHPVEFQHGNFYAKLRYEPAESEANVMGGNSSWRGPVWFPINYLMIERLQVYDHYFGDAFKVESPVGSGNVVPLWDVASMLSERLIGIFKRDPVTGLRPCNGTNTALSLNPRFSDIMQFFEYFNGDNSAGIGAAHQTGWTALVGKLIQQSGAAHSS